MSDTLRDQLMGLGFKPAPKPERKNDGPRRDGRPQGKGGNGAGSDELDLHGASPGREGGCVGWYCVMQQGGRIVPF